MKNSNIIISFITISIVSLTAYWFYNNFNYITETVEIGYQGEARKNPVLAAEVFLERMGASVESHYLEKDYALSWDFFVNVLNRDDILILRRNKLGLTDYQIELLLDWVKAGGHLIMDSQQNDDALLTKFRITLSKNNGEVAETSPIAFYWQGYPLEVAFNQEFYFKAFYDPINKISNKNGTFALFYYFSQGYVTILSDLAFIENNKIGEYDHAQFLWHLVTSELAAKRVFFLQKNPIIDDNDKNQFPSLWSLLWTNMSSVIISALLLLLFWLWATSHRFGSLLPEPPRSRRRLLEHIEASGQFLWKQDQAVRLLTTERKALLKRIESVHPDWIQLSRKKLSQELAQISDLSVNEIEMALEKIKPKTEMVFTRNIQVLSKIMKRL
jgi:hypothetical protein